MDFIYFRILIRGSIDQIEFIESLSGEGDH